MLVALKKGEKEMKEKILEAACKWFEEDMLPKAASNPPMPNPWLAHKAVQSAASASSVSVGQGHVMDYNETDPCQAVDARKTNLEAQGIVDGVKVLHRDSGNAFIVNSISADGSVKITPSTGKGQKVVQYADFRNNYEPTATDKIVMKSSTEVDLLSDSTFLGQYWINWAFTVTVDFAESLDAPPELKIQLEPRKAVFATSKIAKDKLQLPLYSPKLMTYTAKGDYSFPNYGRLDLTEHRELTFAFVPTSFKAKFAPGWAVSTVSEKEEANCVIKMMSPSGEKGIKIPVIVNSKAIEKNAEVKVYKKKMEKPKPEKADKNRLTDQFTAGPPAKRRR
jgi:hypothetical protein